ncbi:MAG: NADPH:quinone oxidoreductase [Novosphingobium sp. SCN 63-17]|nr:NADPH:quinone oxidoreductase family protein [Novosphingobium sp. SCN 63-17]ODU81659.1 MAG: NADPH:quinone oxidoreductase [Novosphingobium sp. SCN 63-17]
MRALLSRTPGGPDSLTVETIDDPECGPGDVVIDVHACGINYPDLLLIEDKYQFRPQRPFAPGGEVAGVIRRVGAAVTDHRAGDRVIGLTGWNGMADQVACAAGKCVRLPDAMPFSEGAAFLGTYGTSYHALKQRAALKRGESLLVLGAAGGVGIAAVELAKAMGAYVVAAASSQLKVAFALGKGADSGLVYPSKVDDSRALASLFREAAPASGFDVVYDAVGGSYAEAAFRSLDWGGRHLVVGFPAGIHALPLNLPLLKGASAIGVFYGAFTEKEPAASAENIEELFALYGEGHIRPAISELVSLEDAAGALARLASREAKGKLVVCLR